MKSPIHFFLADIRYKLAQRIALREWIARVVKKERKDVGEINFIFCSDEYLLRMNHDHLRHDYYTDVITFDYSSEKEISGEIYISVDRVRDNAKTLGVPIANELHRVMIHGVLHLLDYKDKTPADAKRMRAKEDECLDLLNDS
ncbi:MAG: rRNA maturation RNase YbeY [Flavobacteriales bacterium]